MKDVLVLSRNINDYKQKEEEYQEELKKIARDAKIANAAKTSFLRRMSHDMRTPVNGIRGMAVIAEKVPDVPLRVKECVQKIIASSDYLLALLDDVLRMGQLESGHISYEKKPYDVRKVLADTAAFIKERALEKEVDFQIEAVEIVHDHVIGSPLHLRQVLQNVMSNAVKFNRANGSVRVRCREISVDKREKAEYALYEFVCEDNGIGMSPEFQKNVFEAFSQEVDSARTHYESLGSGMGLPIAKEILEQRGGSIDFVSEKGNGTVFTIRIPIQIDSDFYAEEEENADGVSIEGVRILVAEDNELNMEIAKCLLEDEGAVITEAYNGREAVEIFAAAQAESFDVILMDIMMPEMDGLEAARTIRQMEREDAKEIPIFAMTANAFVDDVNRSLEAGMNEHLAKPLDIKILVKMIHKYCRKK